MALIIKFAQPKRTERFPTWDYSNKDAITRCVHYIHAGVIKLSDDEEMFGFVGIPEGTSPEEGIEWMMRVKKIYGSEDGVQCKHIIISFGKKPAWKRKKYRKLVEQIVGVWKGHFQVCWGYHNKYVGTPQENFHLHIMVNSIDLKTGKRLDLNYKRWRQFKKNVRRRWETMTAQNKYDTADG